LLIADAAELGQVMAQHPLDQINKAKQQPATISGFELNTRVLADGKAYLVLGPESEMAVVGSPEIAKSAELIQASRLGNKEYLDVGQTQLAIYPVEGKEEDYRGIVVLQENWQPLLEQSLVAEHGFIAKIDQLSGEEIRNLQRSEYECAPYPSRWQHLMVISVRFWNLVILSNIWTGCLQSDQCMII
jgi:hypothetical protein